MQSEHKNSINRRQFFLNLPLVFSCKTKKQIEVIVESNNNTEIFHVEEDTLKNIFNKLIVEFPLADVFEINYNQKERYLLKKYKNVVPLIFGMTIWIVQNWNYSNKTWDSNGELFCFNF